MQSLYLPDPHLEYRKHSLQVVSKLPKHEDVVTKQLIIFDLIILFYAGHSLWNAAMIMGYIF